VQRVAVARHGGVSDPEQKGPNGGVGAWLRVLHLWEAGTMPWGWARVKAPRAPRNRLGNLTPGKRGELAAVLGEHRGDGLAAIENDHAAVRDPPLAPHDDRAEHPGVAV